MGRGGGSSGREAAASWVSWGPSLCDLLRSLLWVRLSPAQSVSQAPMASSTGLQQGGCACWKCIQHFRNPLFFYWDTKQE